MARKFFRIDGYLKSHGGSKEFDDRHVYKDLRFVENGTNQLRKVDTALVPPALTGYVDPNAGVTEFYFSGKPSNSALIAVRQEGILIEDYEKVGIYVAGNRFFDRCVYFGIPATLAISMLSSQGGPMNGVSASFGLAAMGLFIFGMLRVLSGAMGGSVGLASTTAARAWLATQQE